VQAEDADGDGISITADAISGGTIKASADGTTAADLTHDAVAADPNQKVDGSQVPVPAVHLVSFNSRPSSGDTYERGESIEVQVAFDRPVVVTGSPQVALSIGSRTRQATYDSRQSGGGIDGSGTEYWSRYSVYTVQAEDVDTDGVSIAANAITLNGGSIKAAADATTDAGLTHAAVAADAGHKVDGSRVTAPAVTNLSVGAFSNPPLGETITFSRGDTIFVDVAFDRPVRVTGSPQVALTIGSSTRQATASATSGTTSVEHVKFQYTVQTADVDTDGVSIAANAISLNGGSITGADGVTAADLTHAAVPADPTRKVDGSQVTTPTVLGLALYPPPANEHTYELDETITVAVLFEAPVTVTGSPRVALTIGSRTRHATHAPSVSYDLGFTGVPGIEARVEYFTYTVQAGDVDTDGISIAANAISLNGGSNKAAADGATDANLTHQAFLAGTDGFGDHDVDGGTGAATAPAVSGISFSGSPADGDTYESGETIRVEVVFDLAVTVTGSPRVALTVGSRTRHANLPGSPGSSRYLYFEYEVQTEDTDADGISIAANAIGLNGGSIKAAADGTTDADLTHSAVGADDQRKVDGSRVTAPAVSSISFGSTPASGDTYELNETIQVRVEFDRPVTVTGTPQLALTIGTRAVQATLPGHYADGDEYSNLYFEYAVQSGDRGADGVSIAANAITLNGGTIDAAADGTTDANLTHEAVPADAGHKVDGSRVTAPAVNSIGFASRPAVGETYELGETVEIEVAFDRPVTVTGTPQLALNIGSRTRQATLLGHSSSSRGSYSRYFGYVVQSGDRDADGVSIAANAISLNGGSIKAEADGTTDADLTHAGVAADADHKVDGSQVSAPAVESIHLGSSPADGDTYELGELIQVAVEFDRAVTVTGSPQVALTAGSRVVNAPLSSTILNFDTDFLQFEYRVQAADADTDGISIAANAIRLNGGSIRSAADRTTDADLTHAAVAADPGHKVDGSRVGTPMVGDISFGGIQTGPAQEMVTIGRGDLIGVLVVFNRPVRVTGSPRVTLTIGSRTRQAAYASGGAGLSQQLYFEYTVQASDVDTDGISIPANAISLNGGSITAADGVTAADLTHGAGSEPNQRVDGNLVTVPRVLGLGPHPPPANGHTYESLETITVLVAFERPVTVTGSPRVALSIGTMTRYATHAPSVAVDLTPFTRSIPGIERLVEYFTYTVQADDLDTDGISIPANAISLNGGSITAAADGTTDAVLTHGAVSAGVGFGVYEVDGSAGSPPAPVVSGVSFSGSPADGDTYELGETIEVRVEFDSAVTVTGSPRVALAIGSSIRHASLPGYSIPGPAGSRSLYFEYEVQAADRDADGISIAANAISLNGGSITAAADGTTDADLTHAAVPADAARKVDGSQVSAPEVISLHVASRPSSGTTYVRGDAIEVEVGFSEAITVTGSPELALTVGSASRGAYFVRSGARTLWFQYRVQGQDRDSDGIGIAADALTPKGGTIKDLDGNDALLDLGVHAISNSGDHRVDAEQQDDVAPEILSVAISSLPQSGATYVLGEAIEVQVEFSEPVAVTG